VAFENIPIGKLMWSAADPLSEPALEAELEVITHQHHLDSGKWSARCIVQRQASPAPSAKSTRRTVQQLTLMQSRRTHRMHLQARIPRRTLITIQLQRCCIAEAKQS